MKQILCVALVLLLSRPAWAVEVPGADRIETQTLDNGLTVIVWPDHVIPSVALYIWVRAGGRNEVPGITGLSHFFEHMMFNGTTRRAPGEFDRTMEASGGGNNAYTSNDVTVYQDWFHSSALETIFDLEGDRFANLSFTPKVIESERGVVFSERRSGVDNDNNGYLFEQLFATAFVAHPYQFPVLGWPSDISAWSLEDLQQFFKTYYAPNNLTMLVMGDVDSAHVFELARTHFGPIPAQSPPPAVRTVEPEQTGEKRVEIVRDLQTPLLQIAYKAPAKADERVPALQLLLYVLTGGDSSRLQRRLVDQEQVAISVGDYHAAGFDPGLLTFFLTLPPGTDTERAENLLYEELQKIADEGVTEQELAKAKKNVLVSFWRQMATIDGRASALGNYEVFHNDYRKVFNVPDQYGAVTSAQIKQLAGQLFRVETRTVGVMRAPTKNGGAQ